MDFEWDEAKARSNDDKHGVSFEAACLVFRDPFAVEFEDDRSDYGEDRFIVIGQIQARLVTVVYTWRDSAIRLISARGADPHERRLYDQDRRS